jgi:serine/threonine protein kinase
MNYFTWDRRLEMLHDVAAGMMYLHKRYYVHGDLRSPNLFVGLDGRVKIGDFGFTKRLSDSKASMQVKRITHPRWVAPEVRVSPDLFVV